ncbi:MULTISPECIES: glycosyltransferase family 2 protein [Halorussus]|uniref:glycosyltransferase family 2 protein n=1 Tax=Halorussus TaxID=1070314 RepID=UPI000E21B091|nr:MULTISPECIES: glycosyltransferase family 2 protein [Halorussus]NHN61421.1 glycosyltransferase family 2 protein [Halorussus sp. JP-T4]
MMGASQSPVVSVVIPTYNRAHRLADAIETVADQTYDPIELVVVDDCSEVPVADQLDDDYARHFDKFEVLRHDENRGGAAARNTGMREATGDYIALLDDDDRWEPEKVARHVERFREDDVGLVTSGSKVVDDEGNKIQQKTRFDMPRKRSALTKTLLCRNVVGSCSAVMVDADVVEATGGFDERFPSWQDLEWYVRLSRHCRFGAVPEPLLRYTRHSGDRLTDDLDAVKDESYPLFVEKYGSLAAEFGPVFERKMRAWTAYRVGKELVMADRVWEGRPFLKRAVRLYPVEPKFFKHFLPSVGGPPTYQAARWTKRTLNRLQ